MILFFSISFFLKKILIMYIIFYWIALYFSIVSICCKDVVLFHKCFILLRSWLLYWHVQVYKAISYKISRKRIIRSLRSVESTFFWPLIHLLLTNIACVIYCTWQNVVQQGPFCTIFTDLYMFFTHIRNQSIVQIK